jgi:hypothetical protein
MVEDGCETGGKVRQVEEVLCAAGDEAVLDSCTRTADPSCKLAFPRLPFKVCALNLFGDDFGDGDVRAVVVFRRRSKVETQCVTNLTLWN